jgi:DtxR family Mn-dependent transcriptional regulator
MVQTIDINGAPAKTSPVIEDYLLLIYSLETDGKQVIAARLAESLGVKAPTVTQTLHRMQKEGLIETGGREIRLTQRGRELAEFMTRRHRLAERFLTDVLGFSWHNVHEEAHRFEHGITPEIERRLRALLGNPRTCPHGSPLPGEPGLPVTALTPISAAPPGTSWVVDRILEQAEEDVPLMEFLMVHGLKPEARVTIAEVAPYNGTITVTVNGQTAVLGTRAAEVVLLRPA